MLIKIINENYATKLNLGAILDEQIINLKNVSIKRNLDCLNLLNPSYNYLFNQKQAVAIEKGIKK